MTSDHESHAPDGWTCPGCKESLDDTFHACWNCGTTRDGVKPTIDPETEPTANAEDDDLTSKTWLWVWIVSWVSVFLGATVYASLAPGGETEVTVVLIFIIFMAAMGLVAPFAFFYSMLPSGKD
tara:strand:+ start:811 stop:1182 length:372 start_codon:yes stop_codon:yes gene_type:complete